MSERISALYGTAKYGVSQYNLIYSDKHLNSRVKKILDSLIISNSRIKVIFDSEIGFASRIKKLFYSETCFNSRIQHVAEIGRVLDAVIDTGPVRMDDTREFE